MSNRMKKYLIHITPVLLVLFAATLLAVPPERGQGMSFGNYIDSFVAESPENVLSVRLENPQKKGSFLGSSSSIKFAVDEKGNLSNPDLLFLGAFDPLHLQVKFPESAKGSAFCAYDIFQITNTYKETSSQYSKVEAFSSFPEKTQEVSGQLSGGYRDIGFFDQWSGVQSIEPGIYPARIVVACWEEKPETGLYDPGSETREGTPMPKYMGHFFFTMHYKIEAYTKLRRETEARKAIRTEREKLRQWDERDKLAKEYWVKNQEAPLFTMMPGWESVPANYLAKGTKVFITLDTGVSSLEKWPDMGDEFRILYIITEDGQRGLARDYDLSDQFVPKD